MLRFILPALVLSTTAFSAKAESFDAMAYFKERAFDALAISRVADRLCTGLVLDQFQAKMSMESLKISGWNEIPRKHVERALSGFENSTSDACEYAWAMYGIGSGGQQNPGLRFLRRGVANPFPR
ncbi:hypothetical protein [Methylobacterium oryzisoli]|uniref:hypothetical protein n=1 Tax=Methylobacterium oryzisoli TaxID=3385502 RepID=UPI003891E713